jgi:hypothetical protein
MVDMVMAKSGLEDPLDRLGSHLASAALKGERADVLL